MAHFCGEERLGSLEEDEEEERAPRRLERLEDLPSPAGSQDLWRGALVLQRPEQVEA